MIKQNAFNSIPNSTTRDDRVTQELIPETIGLDQRPLIALIAEIRSIAKDIHFIDETKTNLGTWQQFLDEDILFFLGQLQQFSTEKAYQQIVSTPSGTLKSYLRHLVKTVDHWYKKALSLSIDPLSFELENAINNQLKKSSRHLEEKDLQSLHHIWQISTKEECVLEKMSLKKSIETFEETILYIQSLCKTLFDTYAAKQEISKPHVALILSFLKLYKHIQDKFNNLTKKHLDYYFQELLGQSKKRKEPERTPVFFELAKEAKGVVLPNKTVLMGGIEEDGEEILFETMEDLNISKATLTDLVTIYIANNLHISPHNKAGLITGIYENTIEDVLELNPNNTPLQLFGQDGFEATELYPISHSEIGWAVSGPIFILKEGLRKVTLNFNIEKESLSAFKKQMQKITKDTGTKEKVWIHRFFNQTFKLSLTTNEGWFFVTQFLSTIKETEKDYQLTFSFSLAIDAPAITSYNKEVHKGTYKTGYPVLKIVLDKNKVYYPYSFLRHSRINTIHTKVEVQKLRNLEVYDQYGRQDTSKPFYLFGPQPGKAAACYVGYDEWRYKSLTALDFKVKWYQISNANLAAIYRQYPEKIKADSFKISISSLSNRKWKASKKSLQAIPLFHKTNDDIETETLINIHEPVILKMVPDFEHKETPVFDEAKNGYFRWQLVAPDFGFGHDIYTALVNEKVLEIAKDPKKARKKNIQIPPTPFSPEVQYIEASYTAEQEFILHSEEGKRTDKRFPFELFHIHPFGLLSTATQTYVKNRSLLPYFEDKGYLYMGIKDVTPLEELSFYFKIETQRVGVITKEPLEISWEYLLGEYWKRTSSTFLLYDGTDHFQHSGIIRIKMPKHLEHHHPLFEKEKAWLRLSVSNTLSSQMGKVVCIQLNGVETIRKINKKSSSQTTVTKPNTIDAIYTPIPGIKSVLQPFIPTGGVVTEKQQDFYTRVSERLFHKKRGVLPSDFEVLILEAFSQVYQASCFPSTLFPKDVPPGTIQIMVLPFIYEDTPEGERKFNGYTLKKIKQYIEGLCMHHKSLIISNAFYETIRVSCTVTFDDAYETGTALQKLITTINRFIAPWILQDNENGVNTSPQHQILHPSSLLSHLLALPEVLYISGLSMVQIHQFEKDKTYDYRETMGMDEEAGLQPTKPWSVFVPSMAHNIEVVNELINTKATHLQIGTMEIENDFILKTKNDNENNRKE
ncbi:hypothetical protein [Flavivirga jejuensis]|uniref:Baseplate J-like protein n=1 Tax=Flavivirga jejuensis TaxID=870487 RepID=A0ABT8WP50_9FLAO|nr:hypothetical protein [Flavivirga jejuensis]MDO5974925.1 hypothetical protein [Flavivirga jejuensis]